MLVWCTKVWFQSFLRKQSLYIICPPIFWKKQYKTAVSELSQEGCLYSSRGLNVQKITSLNPIVILVIFHEKKLLANTYCVVKKNLPIQNTLTRDRCLQWHYWTPQHQRNLLHLLRGEMLEGCSWQLGIRQTFWKSPLPDS